MEEGPPTHVVIERYEFPSEEHLSQASLYLHGVEVDPPTHMGYRKT